MTKIAINGFGRIGRPTLKRIIENHPDLELAAINDLTNPETLAHLLKYDSLYGIYDKEVSSGKDYISVSGKKIKIIAEPEPEKLPWKKMGIDIVLECTGRFTDLQGSKKHLKAGAKKVIISAPAKSPEIPGFVLGVNEEKFDPKKDQIIDMGSCTTNCLAPVVKVINDNLKIIKGFMTTVHSYTNDQRILDLPHKDLRRARAAGQNIIPTTTGATEAIGKIIPQLKGKLEGIAVRVPTPTVSLLDLVCQVEKSISAKDLNNIFKKASKEKKLKGILEVNDKPLVSSDYIGSIFSAIVDTSLTAVQKDLVKLVAWYDNEYGYACRLAEFAEFVGEKL